MEAGERSEAEVEREVVEPWETRVNMCGASLLGKVLVVWAQVLHVGRVVGGDDEGVGRPPHVSVQSEEAIGCEVAGFPCRRGCTASGAPLVADRLGEERHGHMARADGEVVRTSPVPSEGWIGVAQLLNGPSLGRVTGERIGCIGVRRGQEGLESPVVGMLPPSLNALKEGRRWRVGAWDGPLGSGQASPPPQEACRREEGEGLAHSGWPRPGHQQVTRRVLVDLSEACLGDVLCVGQDQHAGLIRRQQGTCPLEPCRGSLGDGSGSGPGRATARLGRIRIEDKAGLSHLGWAGSGVCAMATPLAFAGAASPMRVDDPQCPLGVSGGSPQASPCHLKPLRVSDREGAQEWMDWEGGHDDRQTVAPCEPLGAQGPLRAHARDTSGGFLDPLACNPWRDALAWLSGPSTAQLPGAQPQGCRHQEPEADQLATDRVGQALSPPAFEAWGGARFRWQTLCGSLRVKGRGRLWTRAVQVFFAGPSLR